MRAILTSYGCALGLREIANADLKQFPSSAIPLIFSKTGVSSRRHAGPEESTSTLAMRAAVDCLESGMCDPLSIDAVILATSTPDRLIPATAAKVASAIGARRAYAFDINSVCSGGVFALEVARSLIKAGSASNVLIIGSDTYSKFLNPTDFSTYPYFGDGAGAVLMTTSGSGYEVVGSLLETDGSGYEEITLKAGGSEFPHVGQIGCDQSDCFFRMNGRNVFEFATSKGPEIISKIVDKYGLVASDLGKIIVHQANINIIRNIANSLGVGEDRFYVNLHKYGNTAGASVLIAMCEYMRLEAKANMPRYVMLASFGGGLSWGGCLLGKV